MPVEVVPLIGPATLPTITARNQRQSHILWCHQSWNLRLALHLLLVHYHLPNGPLSMLLPQIVIANPPRQTSNSPKPSLRVAGLTSHLHHITLGFHTASPPPSTTFPFQPCPLPRFNFSPLPDTPTPPVSNPTSQPC